MPKIKKKAFFYPSQPSNTSSDSPIDQANHEINKTNQKNNMLINLTEGIYNSVENFNSKPLSKPLPYNNTEILFDYNNFKNSDINIHPFKSIHRPGNNSH